MRNPKFLLVIFALSALAAGCGDNASDKSRRAQPALPPIFPQAPVATTTWDASAGPVMLVSVGSSDDSAAIVLPDVNDSTITALGGSTPSVSGLSADVFGRSGKLDSSVAVSQLSGIDTTDGCYTWPAARINPAPPGWRVAFARGRATAVKLDSIEAMKSVDSAALAVALTQIAATLPVTADPVYRGLPFRIRSAYTFRFDSIDAVIADVIRSVNEEANPRLEHLLLIGERPAGTTDKYSVVYYNRTAGAEETTQVTEVLAVVRIGASAFPVAVLSVEYNEGGRYGLLERVSTGEWRTTWRSAYTGC